jgi:uncharacterized membrane protein
MNALNGLVFVCCVLAIGTLSHLLPQFTRPDLFFGVTVDPAFRNTREARRILRSYRIAIWCFAIAASSLVLVLHRPPVALILFAIGISGAQVLAHRSASIHAAPRATAIRVDLSAPREHIPGGILTAVLPLVVLLGLGLWAIPHLDELPTRLPVHWSLGGANRWLVTSARTIIVLLLQHASICLVLIASALGVLHWSRRIAASGPSAISERQFRRRAVLLILTVEYLMILPPIFGLLQAPALYMDIWSVAVPITVLAFVIGLMHAGQGGARLSTASGHPTGDRTADARWIGGLIYFNPADPALFVERRMGIGWTLNFGNLWSWTSMLAVAAVVLVGPALREIHSSGPLNSAAPNPGTEDSLRRYILSLEQAHPNYEEMSPQLAAAVNRQLPKLMELIGGLGEFKSLTYEGTDSDGSDVYLAAFERGQLQWHIGPLVDGKVTYRRVRPVT